VSGDLIVEDAIRNCRQNGEKNILVFLAADGVIAFYISSEIIVTRQMMFPVLLPHRRAYFLNVRMLSPIMLTGFE